MERGDIIKVSNHVIKGKTWTRGHVGVILGPSHTKGIDNRDIKREYQKPLPPIKRGWWIVSVENDRAKGGYAYISLPTRVLKKHKCTDKCPRHLCM